MKSIIIIILLIIIALLNRSKLPADQPFSRSEKLYGLVAAYYPLLSRQITRLYNYAIGKTYLRYAKLCYGQADPSSVLTLLISQSLVYLTIGLAVILLLLDQTVDPLVKLIAVISSLLLASLPFVKLRRRYNEMTHDIMYAMPTFVYQLAMLIRSGATVEAAVHLIYRRLESDHALTKLLDKVYLATERGEHLSDAFGVLPELIERREIHHLILLMSQVSHCGVYHFADQLIALGDMIIRDRQTMVKTISEQLSTKLLLPMMLSMITIMVILVYPILAQL